MWRPLIAFAAVAALACTLSVEAPDRAVAGHVGGKDCGIVSKGSRDYRVRAQQMRCKRARRGVERYLHKQKPRKGFDCAKIQGRTRFYCKSGAKAYWAVRL